MMCPNNEPSTATDAMFELRVNATSPDSAMSEAGFRAAIAMVIARHPDGAVNDDMREAVRKALVAHDDLCLGSVGVGCCSCGLDGLSVGLWEQHRLDAVIAAGLLTLTLPNATQMVVTRDDIRKAVDDWYETSDGPDALVDAVFWRIPNADGSGALQCRTFSADGRASMCDRPARYIVWGHLYEKQHQGPKCWEHAPKPKMGHDAVEQDYVATMPHAAIYEIPLAPAMTLPNADGLRTYTFDDPEVGPDDEFVRVSDLLAATAQVRRTVSVQEIADLLHGEDRKLTGGPSREFGDLENWAQTHYLSTAAALQALMSGAQVRGGAAP